MLKHIWNAFFYSLDGLKAAFKDELAFRIEVFLLVPLVPLACYFAPDGLSLAVMLLCLFLVLMAELVNTAIEAAIDRMGKEKHALSKKAKDVGSAVVFLAAFNTALVWGIILYPVVRSYL